MQVRISCILCFLYCSLSALPMQAQTIEEAANSWNRFVQLYNSGASVASYPVLYQGYEAYYKVLNESDPESASHVQARTTLKNMLPYLDKAIMYYYQRKEEQQAFKFAQAYVAISIHPAMQVEDLSKSDNYINYMKMAAKYAWENQDYTKAILFFTAYLNTGDNDTTNFRLQSYMNLGLCYSMQGNYAQAKTVLEEGLRRFPRRYELLNNFVDACIKTNDKELLKTYLPMAFEATKSQMPVRSQKEQETKRGTLCTLLKYLGEIQEKDELFDDAVLTYTQMQNLMPNAIEPVKHLALDYLNAGIKNLKFSKLADKTAQANSYRLRAETAFIKAEPLLNDAMANDPKAVVKYAFGLATVYSCLGQQEKLKKMNELIVAWGYEPIGDDMQQSMAFMNVEDVMPSRNMHRQPNDVAASPTVAQPLEAQPAITPKKELTKISDVDINIPVNKQTNENTFAVIIANEHYSEVAPVPMAGNDGREFAEYCQKVLGLPKNNVRTHYDVTSLQMSNAILDIKQIAEAYEGDLNIIFYYAGHGVPNEATRDAFLLPVDANGQNTHGLLSLSKLYEELGTLGARCVTVFLDACFSGSQRGDGMLASARGVAIKAKPAYPKGNTVVFSAATDAETAMPYMEQQHGLFTYYLLKKLQETKGDVTLEELGQYVCTKVRQQAQVVNRKPQTPTVRPSSTFENRWKTIKLIQK